MGSNRSFQHEVVFEVFFLTHPRLVQHGLQGGSSQRVLEESFSLGVAQSSCELRTASTSWCPAALKFPLAPKIYYLSTSHLQLSTALLPHSCCRPTADGKSYQAQIASKYCASQGLMLKTASNQGFGISVRSLRLAKCKTTNICIFFLNQVKLNKPNTRWHLCLFGCKHLD